MAIPPDLFEAADKSIFSDSIDGVRLYMMLGFNGVSVCDLIEARSRKELYTILKEKYINFGDQKVTAVPKEDEKAGTLLRKIYLNTLSGEGYPQFVCLPLPYCSPLHVLVRAKVLPSVDDSHILAAYHPSGKTRFIIATFPTKEDLRARLDEIATKLDTAKEVLLAEGGFQAFTLGQLLTDPGGDWDKDSIKSLVTRNFEIPKGKVESFIREYKNKMQEKDKPLPKTKGKSKKK